MISRENDKKERQLTQKRKKKIKKVSYILKSGTSCALTFHHYNINANKKIKMTCLVTQFPILFDEVILDWLTKKAELMHQTYTTFLFILVVSTPIEKTT